MKRIDPATGKVYDDEEGIVLPAAAPVAPPALALNRHSIGVTPQGLAVNPDGSPMRANVPVGGVTEVPPTAPVGPAPVPGVMQPPGAGGLPAGGMMRTGKSSGGSTSYTKVSDEERRIRGEQAKAAEDEVDLAKQQGAIDIQRAEVEKQQAAAKAAHDAEWEAKRASAEAQANAHIVQRQEAYQAEVQRLRETEPHDFWANKSTGEKIAGALAVALGAYGGALSGHGGNVGLSIINSAIEQDARVQQEKMAKQRELVGLAKEGVGEARLEKADMFRDLQARKEAAWERVGDEFAAKAKELGPSQAGLLAQKNEAAARAKAQQIQLETAELDRKNVQSHWANQFTAGFGGAGSGAAGGKPSESQQKDALLGQAMTRELDAIDKNRAALTPEMLSKIQANSSAAESADKASEKGFVDNLLVRGGRAVGLVPRSRYDGLSPEQQRVANGIDVAVESYARILTGSGMPEQEARREAQTLAPHAGDSPQQIDAKLQRLRASAGQLLQLAGPAAASGGGSTLMQQQAARPKLSDKDRAEFMKFLSSPEAKADPNKAAFARSMLMGG